MKRYLSLLSLLAVIPVMSYAEAPLHVAVTPVQRPEPGQQARHDSFNKISQEGKAELVFLGDSITQGWGGAGKEAFAKHFAPLNAVEFGVGGDRTEHVLWRLQNGNFVGLKPKAVVLLIGTNNTGHQGRDGYTCTAEQTADGVKAILFKLKELAPESKVLLLAVFPRGSGKEDAYRKQNDEINKIIQTYADNQRVFFMDINDKLMNADGTLSPDVMPDKLHLSPKGYEIWAEAIEGKVKELMQ